MGFFVAKKTEKNMAMNSKKWGIAFLMITSLMLPVPAAMIGVDFISSAYASSDSKQLNVNATVVSNCNFTSGGGGGSITLDFGNYDTVGTQETNSLDSTTNFDSRCSKGTSVSLSFDTGQHASGSIRRMEHNGEYLVYEIYSDSGFTTVWGSGAENDMEYTSTQSAPESKAVYGRILPGQDVSIGTYSDTLTLTATF